MTEAVQDKGPLSFRAVAWLGYIFAGMFLLHGGVSVILAFLDHKYGEIMEPLMFAVIGLALLMPVMAYVALKPWGYWGLVGINGLVLLLALIDLGQIYNLVPLAMSAVALFLLFRSETKEYLFGPR